MISTRQIAHALGGQVAGARTILCPGPGHSANDRSLAVRIDPHAPDGFVCFSHCGDDWKQCRDHVRVKLGLPAWQPGDNNRRRVIPDQHIAKWDMASVETEADEISEPRDADELDRINYAQSIWKEAVDPRGTLADIYLTWVRKLNLPAELAGAALRFHGECPWRNENTGTTDRVPALIAPFRSIDDNDITAVHRIALNADGNKRGRRMLGIVRRTAIKLDAINSDTLVIGEGIETCMAARQLGLKPTWALGSVGAIAFFPLLDNVRQLTILAERDDASRRATDISSAHWRKAGKRVRVALPDPGYGDFNDIVAERHAS